MSKTEKVAASELLVAQCMECTGVRFLGPGAKKTGIKHAEDNPGHRVHVTQTFQAIYQYKGVQ